MSERRGIVTMQGKGVTLLGDEIDVGEKAADCTLIDADLKPVALSTFFGSPLILISVPSLDTSVCSLEAKRFNKELNQVDSRIKAVLVSLDLPFAQKRWCAAEEGDRLKVLSDYRLREFGERYGLYMLEVGLLARAVFVIDSSGIVRYREIVKEVTQEPNYKKALEQINKVAAS